jgi:hypothetical protein
MEVVGVAYEVARAVDQLDLEGPEGLGSQGLAELLWVSHLVQSPRRVRLVAKGHASR